MVSLVLVYPQISTEDFDMIQSIREQHDQKYFDVVDPHITLVFGTDKINANELVEHVHAKLRDMKAFHLKFDFAKVVEDDSKDFFHAFLFPSDGFEEINAMHDTLYTDILESELRHDIPFIPHLGIGTGNEEGMNALVSQLNKSQISVEGTAKEATIVNYDGNKVSNHLSIPLS